MYESHWGLRVKPFENGADPDVYYPCEAHQGALLKLRYAIENRRDAALLVGPAGVGKTLLIHLLRKQLAPTFAPFVHVVFPLLPPRELLTWIADELGGSDPTPAGTIDMALRRLRGVLEENSRAERHAVVVVDEAQSLVESGSLETLRLLLNFGSDGSPAMTLVLAGQTSFLPPLHRHAALEERLGVKCILRAFTLEETISYVNHRLQAAGATRAIFDNAALEVVHQASGGLARKINRLCDLAMLIGFAEELSTIGLAHIEAVTEELANVVAD